jgi:hypothetical protein
MLNVEGRTMSDHYHDPADLRLLKEMRKLAPADFGHSRSDGAQVFRSR